MDAGQSLNGMVQMGNTATQSVIKLEDFLAVLLEKLGKRGDFITEHLENGGEIDSKLVNGALLPILAKEFNEIHSDFVVFGSDEIKTSKDFLIDEPSEDFIRDMSGKTFEIKLKAGIIEKDEKTGNLLTLKDVNRERFSNEEDQRLAFCVNELKSNLQLSDDVLDKSDECIYAIKKDAEQIQDAAIIHYYTDMFNESTFNWFKDEDTKYEDTLKFYKAYNDAQDAYKEHVQLSETIDNERNDVEFEDPEFTENDEIGIN